MPDANLLEEDLFHRESNLDKRLIKSFDDLDILLSKLREKGKKIVLTQGVWDLIHEGHALYLEAAKRQGDVLIVGVDSDRLTKIRKGPKRPIVPETERLRMLAHLRSVDFLFVRDNNEDMDDLVRAVLPDVMVISKSTKDFKTSVDGLYQFSKKVVCLEPQATTSTTARIRNLTIEGAEKLAEEISKLTKDFLDKIKNS